MNVRMSSGDIAEIVNGSSAATDRRISDMSLSNWSRIARSLIFIPLVNWPEVTAIVVEMKRDFLFAVILILTGYVPSCRRYCSYTTGLKVIEAPIVFLLFSAKVQQYYNIFAIFVGENRQQTQMSSPMMLYVCYIVAIYMAFLSVVICFQNF